MRITVWNEFAHEKTDEAVKAIFDLYGVVYTE